MIRPSFLTKVLGSLAFAGAPLLAFAQATGQAQSITVLGKFLNQFIVLIDSFLVPLVFAVAFIVFLWGVYLYFIQGAANEEKRDTGKKYVVWGLIGFVLMVAVWGIVNLLVNSLGLGGQSRPNLPTFGSPAAQQSNTNTGAFPTAPASNQTGGPAVPASGGPNDCRTAGAVCPTATPNCDQNSGICVPRS